MVNAVGAYVLLAFYAKDVLLAIVIHLVGINYRRANLFFFFYLYFKFDFKKKLKNLAKLFYFFLINFLFFLKIGAF